MKIARDPHNHLSLGQNYDINLGQLVCDELIGKLGAKFIQAMEFPDTAYYDFDIQGIGITLHCEHYTGVYIIPTYFFESRQRDEQAQADKLVNRLEEHFRANFLHVITE